jgi:hypothetical protein
MSSDARVYDDVIKIDAAENSSAVHGKSRSPQDEQQPPSMLSSTSSSSSSSSSTTTNPPVTAEEGVSSSVSPTEKREEQDEVVVEVEVDTRSKEEIEKDEKEKAVAEKKRIEELKKKYADWPLRSIKDPHPNDVMYGRGGGTNHHPGNKVYRKMVEDRKLEYVNSKRLDKPLVALEIIRIWRAQLPPGRFLKLDEKTGLWSDVGDKKAREKTSQALREKAPLIRKQQEEDDMDDEEVSDNCYYLENTKLHNIWLLPFLIL